MDIFQNQTFLQKDISKELLVKIEELKYQLNKYQLTTDTTAIAGEILVLSNKLGENEIGDTNSIINKINNIISTLNSLNVTVDLSSVINEINVVTSLLGEQQTGDNQTIYDKVNNIKSDVINNTKKIDNIVDAVFGKNDFLRLQTISDGIYETRDSFVDYNFYDSFGTISTKNYFYISNANTNTNIKINISLSIATASNITVYCIINGVNVETQMFSLGANTHSINLSFSHTSTLQSNTIRIQISSSVNQNISIEKLKISIAGQNAMIVNYHKKYNIKCYKDKYIINRKIAKYTEYVKLNYDTVDLSEPFTPIVVAGTMPALCLCAMGKNVSISPNIWEEKEVCYFYLNTQTNTLNICKESNPYNIGAQINNVLCFDAMVYEVSNGWFYAMYHNTTNTYQFVCSKFDNYGAPTAVNFINQNLTNLAAEIVSITAGTTNLSYDSTSTTQCAVITVANGDNFVICNIASTIGLNTKIIKLGKGKNPTLIKDPITNNVYVYLNEFGKIVKYELLFQTAAKYNLGSKIDLNIEADEYHHGINGDYFLVRGKKIIKYSE